MIENDNSNLSSIYLDLLSNSLSILSDRIAESFYPIIPHFTQHGIDILSDTVSQLASTLAHSILENIDYEIINAALKDISQYLGSYVLSTLADSISVNSDYVIITEDAVESLNDFFDENSTSQAPEVTSKMSTKDFLSCVLIPLICMIIPMLQSSYYHKLDSIESQRYQLQEAEYQEAILALEFQHNKELEELNTNLNELLQYLESAQDTDSLDASVLTLPPDAQETSFDSPVAENGTVDGTDNHETNPTLN